MIRHKDSMGVVCDCSICLVLGCILCNNTRLGMPKLDNNYHNNYHNFALVYTLKTNLHECKSVFPTSKHLTLHNKQKLNDACYKDVGETMHISKYLEKSRWCIYVDENIPIACSQLKTSNMCTKHLNHFFSKFNIQNGPQFNLWNRFEYEITRSKNYKFFPQQNNYLLTYYMCNRMFASSNVAATSRKLFEQNIENMELSNSKKKTSQCSRCV